MLNIKLNEPTIDLYTINVIFEQNLIVIIISLMSLGCFFFHGMRVNTKSRILILRLEKKIKIRYKQTYEIIIYPSFIFSDFRYFVSGILLIVNARIGCFMQVPNIHIEYYALLHINHNVYVHPPTCVLNIINVRLTFRTR